MLHPPLHHIVGTEVSPILAVEVVEFGTRGEPAIRTTKFLLYLDFFAENRFQNGHGHSTISAEEF